MKTISVYLVVPRRTVKLSWMNAKICAVPNLAQHECARSFQHAKKMVHFCTHVKTSKICTRIKVLAIFQPWHLLTMYVY